MKPFTLWIIWASVSVIILAALTWFVAGVAIPKATKISDRTFAAGVEAGYRQAILDTFNGKARYQIREVGDGRAEIWVRDEKTVEVKTDLPLPSNDLLPKLELLDPPKPAGRKK